MVVCYWGFVLVKSQILVGVQWVGLHSYGPLSAHWNIPPSGKHAIHFPFPVDWLRKYVRSHRTYPSFERIGVPSFGAVSIGWMSSIVFSCGCLLLEILVMST